MKLKTWTMSGEKVHDTMPTRQMLEKAIKTLDWESEDLSGLTLTRDNYNWADGSGNLHPSNGLSLMIEDEGVQHVSENAPTSLDQIVEFLDVYLRGEMTRVYELLYNREFTSEELAELKRKEAKNQGVS